MYLTWRSFPFLKWRACRFPCISYQIHRMLPALRPLCFRKVIVIFIIILTFWWHSHYSVLNLPLLIEHMKVTIMSYLVEPPHFHIVVTHIFMVITPSNNIHDMRFRFPYLIFINKKKNKKTEEYMYNISLKYSCNLQHRYY